MPEDCEITSESPPMLRISRHSVAGTSPFASSMAVAESDYVSVPVPGIVEYGDDDEIMV